MIGSLFKMPNYASWTGVRPIESKLDLLKKFSRKGQVDALFLGSSISDYGFSAEQFSLLMTEKIQKEYRTFNFSTGAAEPRTMLTLYKLARLECSPKNVFVVLPAEMKLGEMDESYMVDSILNQSPIGNAINSLFLLNLSYKFWTTKFMQNLPGIRDLVLYGHYLNLETNLGTELYPLNKNGDRLNFTVTSDTSIFEQMKHNLEEQVKPYPYMDKVDKNNKIDQMAEYYFANKDLLSLIELRKLVAQDGGKLYIVPHAAVVTIWKGSSKEYIRGRHFFYESLSAKTGIPLIRDITNSIVLPEYAMADTNHLNIYGAEIYTQALFNAFTDTKIYRSSEYKYPNIELLYNKNDRSVNTFTAFILKHTGVTIKGLDFKIVDSLAVPALPKQQLFAVLRDPNNHDTIVPVIRMGKNQFRIAFNAPISNSNELYVLRLAIKTENGYVALNAPLADYEWIKMNQDSIKTR
jgi:hypothetical protein